jgi:hypothetical protein
MSGTGTARHGGAAHHGGGGGGGGASKPAAPGKHGAPVGSGGAAPGPEGTPSKGTVTTIDWTKTSEKLPNLKLAMGTTPAAWDAVYTPPTMPTPIVWTVCPTNSEGKHLAPIRCRTLDIAKAYIGTISDAGGSGGNKKGWELLMDVYSTSYHDKMEGGAINWGNFPAEVKKSGRHPNSWCGIFDLNVLRKAGLETAGWLRWDAKGGRNSMPNGLFATAPGGKLCEVVSATSSPEPGDILVLKDTDPAKPLTHHCILASKTGEAIVTYDGNTHGANEVGETNRQMSAIKCFYRVIEDTYI